MDNPFRRLADLSWIASREDAVLAMRIAAECAGLANHNWDEHRARRDRLGQNVIDMTEPERLPDEQALTLHGYDWHGAPRFEWSFDRPWDAPSGEAGSEVPA